MDILLSMPLEIKSSDVIFSSDFAHDKRIPAEHEPYIKHHSIRIMLISHFKIPYRLNNSSVIISGMLNNSELICNQIKSISSLRDLPNSEHPQFKSWEQLTKTIVIKTLGGNSTTNILILRLLIMKQKLLFKYFQSKHRLTKLKQNWNKKKNDKVKAEMYLNFHHNKINMMIKNGNDYGDKTRERTNLNIPILTPQMWNS